ncbi:MAG TPA: hypothetical protein VNJ03_07840 [Vicinamibacterales bacterium]|nr:hypothetical protein [Vicinamibacterales bacterium]
MVPEAHAGPAVPPVAPNVRPGAMLALILLCLYGGIAVSVDFPRTAMGIQSDEATYYMMGHSLAEDGDLTYRREDLVRVWKEFDSGPAGLFLKRGRDVSEGGLMLRPPFFWLRTHTDPDATRLFYGKSFMYPLVAAPFVRLFGTNGFLVLHALLLAGVGWCAYLFLHARAPALPSVILAAAFIMATVVPVYYVWITPELFNFAIVFFGYFCWLYKEVAVADRMPRSMRWLAGGRSDLVAAVLLGIATFSKPTNATLIIPVVLYLFWRRRAGRAVMAGLLFGIVAAGFFAANVAISGEWNYQGGERKTFSWEFPFQTPQATFDSVNTKAMGRDEALTSVIFNESVFWRNLRDNLRWYFVGRYSGLLAYFAPAVFALVAFLAGARRRPLWQWLVLGSAVAQILLFVISLPYTWFGGGGSVGNRYFVGTYGIFLFLMPPVTSTALAVVPWVVGCVFVGKLVVNPFVSSFKPGTYADAGPLRMLPVELSNINDLPINTDSSRVRVWFGDDPDRQAGTMDPGFQIYFLDMNAFREADKTFWVRGESRSDFLIKTDRPMKRLTLSFVTGSLPATITARVGRRAQEIVMAPGESRQITFALDPGFPYLKMDDGLPRFVWSASISSSSGFVPAFEGGGTDTRFLGVRVKPMLVE